MQLLKNIIILLSLLLINEVVAQDCSSQMRFTDYVTHHFESDIKDRFDNPALIKQRLLSQRKKINTRSIQQEIKVLLVYQNVKNTQLSVVEAEQMLKKCAGGFDNCNITFKQVNQTPINYLFSDKTRSCRQMISYVLGAAVNEEWYDKADLVIAIIGDTLDDCGGMAYLGDCDNSIGKAIIVQEKGYNIFLAHEMGHILGMNHDDPKKLPHSVMLPRLFAAVDTMSFINQHCYFNNAKCTFQGVDGIKANVYDEIDHNALYWTTEMEINNKGFFVERSSVGQNWEILSFVSYESGINDDQIREYKYKDFSPFLSSDYRLRFKTVDDKDRYSNVASVLRMGNFEPLLFPNPVDKILTLSFDISSSSHSIILMDALGKIVLSTTVKGGRNEVDVSILAAGIYFVKTDIGNQIFVRKIIKL
jgi:Secretion system C-terminal sorting domain/Metallo-peptidase family M12